MWWNPNRLAITTFPKDDADWWFGEYFDPLRDRDVTGWVVGYQAECGAGIQEPGCPFGRILRKEFPSIVFFDHKQPLLDDHFQLVRKEYRKFVFRLLASQTVVPGFAGWSNAIAHDRVWPMLIRFDAGGSGYMAALLEYGGTDRWRPFIEKLRDDHGANMVPSTREMPAW